MSPCPPCPNSVISVSRLFCSAPLPSNQRPRIQNHQTRQNAVSVRPIKIIWMPQHLPSAAQQCNPRQNQKISQHVKPNNILHGQVYHRDPHRPDAHLLRHIHPPVPVASHSPHPHPLTPPLHAPLHPP